MTLKASGEEAKQQVLGHEARREGECESVTTDRPKMCAETQEEISDETTDQSKKSGMTATREDSIRFVEGYVAVSFSEK